MTPYSPEVEKFLEKEFPQHNATKAMSSEPNNIVIIINTSCPIMRDVQKMIQALQESFPSDFEISSVVNKEQDIRFYGKTRLFSRGHYNVLHKTVTHYHLQPANDALATF